MAFTINHVVLAGGNLTRDAEMRYLPNGTPKLSFDIAMNRSYPDGQGGFKEEVSFFKIVYWGKPAESVAQFLKKGRKVVVEGRLSQRRWQGDDGKSNSIVEVSANTVLLMDSAKRGTEQTIDPPAPDPGYDDTQHFQSAPSYGNAAQRPPVTPAPPAFDPGYGGAEGYPGPDMQHDMQDNDVPF
jgi:single-strand DNA-binding protein